MTMDEEYYPGPPEDMLMEVRYESMDGEKKWTELVTVTESKHGLQFYAPVDGTVMIEGDSSSPYVMKSGDTLSFVHGMVLSSE